MPLACRRREGSGGPPMPHAIARGFL